MPPAARQRIDQLAAVVSNARNQRKVAILPV
jgi:hypothetical protein